MAITAVYGFNQYRNLQGRTYTTLDGLGKLPFIPTHLNDGNSTFTFENYGGKTWLRSLPGSYNRTPSSRCYCDWSTSSGCRRWRRRHYTPTTNANRWIDSSRRTPCLRLNLVDCYSELSSSSDIRYLLGGVRIRLHDNNYPNIPLLMLSSITSEGNQIQNTLFHRNAFPDGVFDDKDSAYVEFEIDIQTGVVRRWVDETELTRLALSAQVMTNLEGYAFQFGVKSTSTAGTSHPTRTGNNYRACPAAITYPYDTGAPADLNYAITDLYFMTGGGEHDETEPYRLGEVEVNNLTLDDFLLNRFWEPPSKPPVDIVNQIKTTNQVSGLDSLVGDAHADPATAVFNAQEIALDEEVIYLGIDVYGHRDNDGASRLNVEAYADNVKVAAGQVTLPTNVLDNSHATRRAITLQANRSQDALPPELLTDLTLKLTFDE